MPAIYILILLVLIGSDVLPLKVYAGSSGSGDSHDSSKSSGSKGSDEHYCRKAEPKQEAIEKKIKSLSDKNKPLPTCTCGSSGTISKIDIFNANSGQTKTLRTCSGCTGPDVPIASSTECKNVPDVFRPVLDEYCQIVHPRCKNITVYRCGSPAVITTEVRTTAPLSTTSFTGTPMPVTSTPLPATTSVASPPATTKNNPPVITITPTPFLIPGYGGVDY